MRWSALQAIGVSKGLLEFRGGWARSPLYAWRMTIKSIPYLNQFPPNILKRDNNNCDMDMFDDLGDDDELQLYVGEDSVSRSDLGLGQLPEPGHPPRRSTGPSNSSRSNKNKYINSINDMVRGLPKQKLSKISQTRELVTPTTTNPQTVPSNRLSAKQSRERKKIYIDLMQAKLAQLQAEKLALEKQLQQAKDNLLRASTLAQQTAGGFTAGRQLIIRKLTQLLSKNEKNEEEINMTLDSLRFRISATGKQRVSIVNQHLKQIGNNCLPGLTRYLMWCASESRHLFSPNPTSQPQPWFQSIFQSVGMSPEQLLSLSTHQQSLASSKQAMDGMIGEIDASNEQLARLSEKSDEVIDYLRGVMSGTQAARVVLFVDSNRCRREIDRLGGEREEGGDREREREQGMAVKKVKRN